MTFEIVTAKQHHIHHVANNLREADLVEARYVNKDVPPVDQVETSAENSSILLAGEADGTPVALAGVVRTDQDEVGVAWMVTTDWVYDHATTFLRRSGDVLEQMYEHGDWLTFVNLVHTSNQLHERWLTWLGAQWHPKIQKWNGAYFKAFYLHREDLRHVHRSS